MKAPITVNGLHLRFLTLRDWASLTERWLAARQTEHEQALRRSGASAADIASALQDYASRKSTYGLLLEMCKTWDGCSMILERAASNAGATPEQLQAALEGTDPDSVAVLAMRACGWDIRPQSAEGN